MGCSTSFESRNKTWEDEMSSGYRVVGFEKLAVADTALGLASIQAHEVS